MMLDLRRIQQRAENFRSLLDYNRILDYNRLQEERLKEKEAERRRGLAKGLVIGALIGGVAALFLAPDTGVNTRRKTKEELDKLKTNLEVGIGEGKEKILELYEDNKGVFESKLISIKEKVSGCCSLDEVCAEEEEE